jgi:exodeoxyribonuclease VII small subunit
MANQRKRSDDDAAGVSAEMLLEDTAKSPEGAPKFEAQLENLEDIVTRIDSGELSLEESIEAFERGVGLVRSLNHKLDEVERRVEVLMRGARGELKSSRYEGETGAVDKGGSTKKTDEDEVPF